MPSLQIPPLANRQDFETLFMVVESPWRPWRPCDDAMADNGENA